MIYIGIDPGTHTGIAVWNGKEFLQIDTFPIHKAMQSVLSWLGKMEDKSKLIVICEDARQRKWFGVDSSKKMQGAGSVKRDCTIWEEFCHDNGIQLQMVHPMKGGTKMTPEYFKTITGWKPRTSNHARDAAMLVFGR